MSVESLFLIAFWLIFGVMIVMQVYFASRLRLAGNHKAADRKAIEREGWGYAIVRAIRSISLITFLVLYTLNQPWLGMLSVPFPNWFRWMGVVLGALVGLGVGAVMLALSGSLTPAVGLPWASIGIAAVLGLAVPAAAAYYPSRVASRLSIVRALQFD